MSSSAVAIESESPNLCAHYGDAGTDMTPVGHVRLSGGHYELNIRLTERLGRLLLLLLVLGWS